MSQSIEIVIRVREAGQAVIDDLVKKLKSLNDAIVGEKIEKPLATLEKKAGDVQAAFAGIQKSVEKIADTVLAAVQSVSAQTQDFGDSTITRISASADVAVEKLYAQATVAVLGLGLLQQTRVLTPLAQALTSTQTISVFVTQKLQESVVWIERFQRTGQLLNAQLLSAQSIVGSLFKAGAGFFVFKIFFGEAVVLVRRLIGQGEAALTPLERATRLMTTFDSAVANIGFTGGQALKTLTFGILAFAGPFSGILAGIPFLNSLISTLLQSFQRSRLRVLAFFGSSRAQMGLIILDLRTLLQKSLPHLLKLIPALKGFVVAFSAMQKESSGADKKIKKLGGGLEHLQLPLKELSRTKLPFAKQFQLAQVEIKAMGADLLALIARLISAVEQAAGLSKNKISDIKSETKGLSAEVQAGAAKTAQTFETSLPTAFQRISQYLRQVKSANIGGLLGPKIEGISKQKPASPASGAANAAKEAQAAKQHAVAENSLMKAMYGRLDAARKLVSVDVAGLQATLSGSVAKKAATADDAKRASALDAEKTKLAEATKAEAEFEKMQALLRRSVKQSIQEMFAFDNVLGTVKTTFAGLASSRNAIQAVFDALKRLSEGGHIARDEQKALLQVMESLISVSTRFGTISDTTKNKLSGAFKYFVPEKVNPAAVKQALVPISKALDELKKEGIIKGETLGGQLISFLAQGVREKSPEARAKIKAAVEPFSETISQVFFSQKFRDSGAQIGTQVAKGIDSAKNIAVAAADKTAAAIAEDFPASPARRGPLRYLTRAGQLVVAQLATGMQRLSRVRNAALKIAENIAGYFPRSPALWGPLRNLVRSGYLIPVQLATGMRSGQGVLAVASEKLAEAANIKHLSDLVNVSVEKLSALGYVLLETGGKAEDLKFSLLKAQETLHKTFSYTQQQEILALGINLEQVKRAGDPVLALFFAVSDALKKLPIGSEESRKALELIGQTASSNLVPALRKGSVELKKIMGEGLAAGSIFSAKFAEVAVRIKLLQARFTAFKEFLVVNFLSVILPELNRVGDEAFGFLRRNEAYIRAIITVGARATLSFFSLLQDVLIFAVRKPGEAMIVLERLAERTITFIAGAISGFYSGSKEDFVTFAKGFAALTLGVSLSVAKNFFAILAKYLGGQIEAMFVGLVADMYAGVKKFVDLLGKVPVFRSTGFYKQWSQGLENMGVLLGNLQKKFSDFTPEIRDAANEAVDIAVVSLGKIQRSGSNILKNVLSKSAVESVKRDFAEFMKGLSEDVAGTPIRAAAENLKTILSDEYFSRLQTNISAAKTAGTTALQEVANLQSNINAALKDVVATPKLNTEPLKKSVEEVLASFTGLTVKTSKLVIDSVTKGAEALNNTFTGLNELAKGKIKELFYAQKAAAISQIIISNAVAAIKAYQEGGPYAGPILAGLIAAQAGVQMAKVIAEQPKFAAGGLVEGPPGRDRVNAWLTRKEFVIPAHRVAQYGADVFEGFRRGLVPRGALSAWRSNFRGPVYVPKTRYAEGGPVVPPRLPQEPHPPKPQEMNFTQVVVMDKDLLQQYLAQEGGQDAVLSVIGRRRQEVRRILQFGG